MNYIRLIVFVLLLVATSCRTTVHTTCSESLLMIRGVGFSEADIHGGRIYVYLRNTGFAAPIDSVQVEYFDWGHDTAYLQTIDAQNDYKIALPAIGRTYVINEITRAGLTEKTYSYVAPPGVEHAHRYCYNNAISCAVDSIPTAIAGNENSGVDTISVRR